MYQQRSETKVLFITLDGQMGANKKNQPAAFQPSSKAGAVVIWQNSQHFYPPSGAKVCVPRSFTEWVSCSSRYQATRPAAYISLTTLTTTLAHSLSLPLSHTHTPIGYVLGQIICLISHPHNPTTSKINQAPQKKKKTPLMASEEHGGRNSLRKLL